MAQKEQPVLERKDELINLRVSSSMYEKLNQESQKLGMRITEVSRYIIARYFDEREGWQDE